MEWRLSRKKEKISEIPMLLVVPVFLTLIFFYFFGYSFAILVSAILLEILICGIIVILSKMGRWDNLVVKLDYSMLTIGRLDPREGFVEIINPIKLDKIYKIVTTKRKLSIYHVGDDGIKYRTILPTACLFIEDKEKRQEIVREILKRIDRKKVEIIDKRKRGTL